MAWLVPENKLDDQQRNFIENVDINQRNVWIKGFPGSGKSVLLAYTLKRIRKRSPHAKVAVVVFTHSLIAMFKDAFIEIGVSVNFLDTYYEFEKGSSRYDYILSDEIQDMTGRILNKMRKRADHIIVAGDENQSIYDIDPRYKENTVSPNDIRQLLNCRDYELGIIHRLSKSIISAVEKFMPDIDIFTARQDMTTQNTKIRLCSASDDEQEVRYIMEHAQKAIGANQTAVILIPKQKNVLEFINTALELQGKRRWEGNKNNEHDYKWGKPNYDTVNKYLERNGLKLQYVGNSYGSFSRKDKICIMTYHSSKGLDFDNVFMPGLNIDLEIYENKQISRTLFMVAMTRSKNNLYLTYSGWKHDYLDNFAADCSSIDIDNFYNQQTSTNIWGI